MKKKDTTSEGGSEWNSPPTGRITPTDVQQKEFQVARFGAGYRMREVDEFLDHVTDALSALTAENERLLRGAGDRAPAPGASTIRPTADDADLAAVEAFLRRERGFLQDLGGLVQGHAEELRSMVRAVRRGPAAPVAEASSAEETRVEPAAQTDVSEAVPEALVEPDARPKEDATAPQATEATPEPAAEPPLDVAEDDREAPEEPTTTVAEVVADEPIRLEEPEPARSSRSDEDEDGSLRELFWGEE
jgi:DivIVA domain-containing protein